MEIVFFSENEPMHSNRIPLNVAKSVDSDVLSPGKPIHNVEKGMKPYPKLDKLSPIKEFGDIRCRRFDLDHFRIFQSFNRVRHVRRMQTGIAGL